MQRPIIKVRAKGVSGTKYGRSWKTLFPTYPSPSTLRSLLLLLFLQLQENDLTIVAKHIVSDGTRITSVTTFVMQLTITPPVILCAIVQSHRIHHVFFLFHHHHSEMHA